MSIGNYTMKQKKGTVGFWGTYADCCKRKKGKNAKEKKGKKGVYLFNYYIYDNK